MLPYLIGYLILSSLVFHVLMFRRLVMMIYRMCILRSSRTKLSTKNQTKKTKMVNSGSSRAAALPPSGESSMPDQDDQEAMLDMAKNMMSIWLNDSEVNDV